MTKLIYADLTYKIRGSIFNVYNTLGFGHKEQVYQKALAEELKGKKINYEREKRLAVRYKGKTVGSYQPDFIIENKIILEIKAVKFMPKIFETQVLNYLKGIGYKLGLLINFGGQRLIIKRLVWTNPRKSVANQRKSLKK